MNGNVHVLIQLLQIKLYVFVLTFQYYVVLLERTNNDVI